MFYQEPVEPDKKLYEKIKELFKEKGVTIGAILTALGMTISTII